MRKIFFSSLLFFSLLLYPFKSFSFDFAPEIGDIAPYFNLKGVNSINKNKTNWDLDYFKKKWLILYINLSNKIY